MESAPFLLGHVPAVVQTVTDWNAVWVGAGATVLGAFGGALVGALLGARGAYKGTLKAQRKQLRWQKLEQALMEVDALYYTTDLNMIETRHILETKGPIEAEAFAKKSEFSASPIGVSRIEGYVEIFLEEGMHHVKTMKEQLAHFNLCLLFLQRDCDVSDLEQVVNNLTEPVARFQSARHELKNVLRRELKRET